MLDGLDNLVTLNESDDDGELFLAMPLSCINFSCSQMHPFHRLPSPRPPNLPSSPLLSHPLLTPHSSTH